MKRHSFIAFLLLVSIYCGAGTNAVTVPSVGDARLRIVGQNAENYLLDLTASNSSCSTQSEFEQKTNQMANAFLTLQADIVAICEVEQNSQVLGYICDEMNSLANTDVYVYVSDNMGNASQSSSGYLALKAGFIYRKDKVVPVGSNTSPYYSGEYNHRLRIQAFKELATNEVFVLSMNHFKAKDKTSDQGESTRLQNVSVLLSELKDVTTDPDIMIMGDLNAYMGEQPIINLQNAGYEEQLIRFDADAYSYIYQGTKGLLDHAMANSTMATQVTGAAVYHCNTSSYYSRFSDHDTYVVGLNLGDTPPVPPTPQPECPEYTFDFCQGSSTFVPYLKGDAEWTYSTTYGLQINGRYASNNQDQWIVSPQLDLSKASSATLTINHQIYYDNGTKGDYEQHQTIWVSNDYVDGNSPENYTWHQLPIDQYAVKSYVDATMTIPADYLTDHTHIAFRYQSVNAQDANFWEIKSANITTECQEIPDAIDQTNEQPNTTCFKRIIDGQLYILVNGRVYDITGHLISK